VTLGDPEIFQAIGETYAGLLEHSLKKTNETDSLYVLQEALKSLFEVMASGSANTRIGACVSVLKIIQSSPSQFFGALFEFIVTNLIGVIRKHKASCTYQCLECLISLCLCNDKQIPDHLDNILSVLIENVCHEKAAVRKLCLDNMHSLCVVCREEMKFYKEEVLQAVQLAKRDTDSEVVRAAAEALNVIRELEGVDETLQEKEDIENVQNISEGRKGKGTGQGKQPKVTNERKAAVQKKEYGINKKNMNPNFMRSGTDEIAIFVSDKRPVSVEVKENVKVAPRDVEEERSRSGSLEGEERPDFGNSTFGMLRGQEENLFMQETRPEKDSRDKRMGFEEDSQFSRQAQFQAERNTSKSPERQKVVETQRTAELDRQQRDRMELGRNQVERERSKERNQFVEITEQSDNFEQSRAVKKSVRKEKEDLSHLRGFCETLKRENMSQAKVIDFQNKRMDRLVTHVQNMTLHINHLLGKVSQLEQTVFHMSNARNVQAPQIILPSFAYPQQPQVQQEPQFAEFGMFNPANSSNFQQKQVQPGNIGNKWMQGSQMQNNAKFQKANPQGQQYPQSGYNQQIQAQEFSEMKPTANNKWKAKREVVDEKPMRPLDELASSSGIKKKGNPVEAVDHQNKNGRVTRPETKKIKIDPVAVEHISLDSGKKKKGEPGRKKYMETGNQLELERESQEEELSSVEAQETESGLEAEEEEEMEEGGEETEEREEEEEEEDLEENLKVKELNKYIEGVLNKENRKVIDFLADYDNLGHFDDLNLTVGSKLLGKLTELVSGRIENQISVCLPWLTQFVEQRRIDSKEEAKELLGAIKTVLGTGKSNKVYQQETLEELERLKGQVAGLLNHLK
jgi:hypothetical protein